jgi:hypothetical protein
LIAGSLVGPELIPFQSIPFEPILANLPGAMEAS